MEKLNVYFPSGDHYRAAQVMDSTRWHNFDLPVNFDAVGQMCMHGYVRLSNPANDPETELDAFAEGLTAAGMMEQVFGLLAQAASAEDVDCGDPDCPVHGKGLDGAFGMEEYKL